MADEREPWKPAVVRGNKEPAMVVFDEDSHGDLVDMRFYCWPFCAAEEDADATYEAAYWPAFDFSTDYDTRCQRCGALINRVG